MADRHTILVVDDEPDVVKSVQDLLRYDYRVLGATRTKTAMEMLKTEPVQVVMTDQRMPEITGVEFLRQIQVDYPEAVRLLCTGYADIRAVIDAINKGSVYRYITKPWDPEELEAVIKQSVERYDLMAERRQLTQQLQAKNAELEQANADLRRANDLKRAFIQVASHELRTPLTILVGLQQLALMQTPADSAVRPLLQRMELAGARLSRLVDQLIKMLRAGQFSRPLDLKPTDLRALLTDAAEDVRPFINLRHQTFDVNISPEVGTMSIEASKIRDCVSHLLLNAIKFTPDSGKVALTAERNDHAVSIRIIDNGAGIDADTQCQLFEPFFTGFDVSHHSSGHYEYNRQGLGLGLSIVKAFAEMHGGAVSCQSAPGQGSTFTIHLPVHE